MIAQGFTLTADQRNAIFATASVENIIDQTGTYTAPPPSPGVVGLTAGNDTIVLRHPARRYMRRRRR